MNLDIIKSITGYSLADHHHDAYWAVTDAIVGDLGEQKSDLLVWLFCDLNVAIEGVRAAWWNHKETGDSLSLALAEVCDDIRQWYY